MKLYRYRYSREYLEHAGLGTGDCDGEDTGVLAQEVKEVLPEAVKESVSGFQCSARGLFTLLAEVSFQHGFQLAWTKSLNPRIWPIYVSYANVSGANDFVHA